MRGTVFISLINAEPRHVNIQNNDCFRVLPCRVESLHVGPRLGLWPKLRSRRSDVMLVSHASRVSAIVSVCPSFRHCDDA